jgi:hypothetical protein
MIRVYIDWNVFSQMKRGMFKDLYYFLITEEKEKLKIFYSTAHIDDILRSYDGSQKQNNIIKGDLDFISEITKDNCLFYTSDKKITKSKIKPQELFNHRIDERNSSSNFSLDSLGELFEDTDSKDKVNFSIRDFKDIPLDAREALSNPDTAQALNELLPGIGENPTMGGLSDAISINVNQMDESGKYKDIRKIFQNGLDINRDKSFNWKNPFEESNKIFNQHPQIDNFINQYENSESKAFVDQFVVVYVKLDMVGFKEDKIEVKKGVKKTFKNTINDAFHAVFASQCNFFVLNDRRFEYKTKAIYSHFKINTQVLKPNEFLEFLKNKGLK